MASSTGYGLSVALVGDLNLGTPINPHNVLDLIKMDFGVFDVKFCNLEGCLFDPNVLLEHKPGWRHCDQAHVQSACRTETQCRGMRQQCPFRGSCDQAFAVPTR